MADTDVADDEDLIVDLNEPDEPLKEPAQGKPPPVPGPGAVPAPAGRAAPLSQTGLKDLETQLSAERQAKARVAEENRRLAAERDQAIAFAQEAERRGMSVYELNNENQIKALTEQMDALEEQHAAAMDGGDFKTAASINRKMHKAAGDLALAERDKLTLAQQKVNMQQQHQRRPPPPQTRQPAEPEPTNALERALQGRTEPTKAFLRKHPDLIRGDGSLKRAAIDAHERALDEGHSVDTQGYFDSIERSIGGAAVNGQGEAGQLPSRQRAPMQAAPVERGSPPGSGGGGMEPGTFVMTPKMRRLAEEQGVSPREWAQNYVRLLKEGRITPIT